MIVTLQVERVRSLEEVRALVEGIEAVDFAVSDRAGIYTLVRRTLVRFVTAEVILPISAEVKIPSC
ncbi:hypothetical protein [Candidatus Foliamicus sp.]